MNLGSPNDVGLVWMSDMLLPGAAMSPDGLMIGSDHRHPFFQTTDLTHQQPLILQDVNGMMYVDEVDDGLNSIIDDDYNAKQAAVLQAAGIQIGDYQPTQCGPMSVSQMADGMTPKRNVSPSHTQAKKIKTVKHPALKLQTPIAYQRDTDINVIPIQKDGMGVCEKCGAIGVKHAFYTKERNYCSLACARTERSNSQQQQEGELSSGVDSNASWASDPGLYGLFNVNAWNREQHTDMSKIPNQMINQMNSPNNMLMMMNQSGLPSRQVVPLNDDSVMLSNTPPYMANTDSVSLSHSSQSIDDIGTSEVNITVDNQVTETSPQSHLESSYSWDAMLSLPTFHAAPVSNFYHAPMADSWDNITVGMKVEVENRDCDHPDSFWVASVLQVVGYKALLRYEGFGQNSCRDFWVNLCSSKVHPVGWCASRAKPLIPPKTIEDKYKDWKHFLVRRLTGARTLPSNFCNKVQDSLKSRFRCDLNLEVVDKNRISQVKVASIVQIVGKRLHVKYYDADPMDLGFWAHEDSPLLHPVGWARRVGQDLDAPLPYIDRCLKGLRDKDDATQDLFPLSNNLAYHTGFRTGMKLEAVDPLRLNSICVATIMKVLNEGYLLVKIESYDESNRSNSENDWFCYHSTSACILPPGFCEIHNLELTPPYGYSNFSWTDYLAQTNSHPAPAELFDLEPPEHKFKVGQKIEATDLMDPRLVCVGTVSMIIGRLIKVHFDGWENEYDQWMDVHSTDLYPVGWCELVSHKLEGPPIPNSKLTKSKIESQKRGRKTRRGRGGGFKAGRSSGHQMAIPVQQSSLGQTAAPGQPMLPSGEMVQVNTRVGDEPSGPDQSLPDSHLSINTPISNALLSCNDSIEELSSENSLELKIAAVHPQSIIPSNTNEINSVQNDSHNITLSKQQASMFKNSSAQSHATIVATVAPLSNSDSSLTPSCWSPKEVVEFLNSNNCSSYTQGFSQQGITGKKLLELTKDEIISLTGKVGPSLKIYDLIEQLKVNHKHERHKSTNKII